MNATFNPDTRVVTVTLSRRNLLTLLHKLDMPDSHRTIRRLTDDNLAVWVTAEDDAEHYGTVRTPGPVHPSSEAFVAEHATMKFEVPVE